jgi:ABC-2 type transport system ATP-binding protein
MAGESVVVTENLTKKYGDFCALDQLSIQVEKGQILGFIGPNGAGKTTTIKILVGLSRPTSGRALINGVDCSRETSRIKQAVGYMPDKFGSYDNMRVREYLDFFGALFGLHGAQRRKRIDAVLEITSASYMADRYVESLSHGMQQRIGIARTLLHDPHVLILDEPANGLDPQARIEMREILLRLADQGKTLIVTSHILPELSRICNVVAIVTDGKLRAFGPLQQVMRSLCPARQFEVQLIRESDLASAKRIIEQATNSAVVVSERELMLRFPTNESEEQLAGVLSQLVSQGVAVGQFRELAGDLEDAFMSVTNTQRMAAVTEAN